MDTIGIIGVGLPDLLAEPAEDDLIAAIAERDALKRRWDDMAMRASAAIAMYKAVEAEMAATTEQLTRASERVKELHDAGFKDAAARDRYYARALDKKGK